MTGSVKAMRATVTLGDLTIDGFMLPDGSYRMSQTQAAECIGKPEINARRFLVSKAIKALLGEGYTPDTIEVESDPSQLRGQSRFNALPLTVVTAFWFNQATQGNQQAIALTWAMLTETLERRFDNAFGITRPEADRDRQLSAQMAQMESDLGTAFAEADAAINREKLLEQQLRDLGVEPWSLPQDEDE
ncbi:MAG TPA: hypothetical protein V6C84_17400 [Coleofasciculaceae cyanobacterium]|jgi:hypothetical protein